MPSDVMDLVGPFMRAMELAQMFERLKKQRLLKENPLAANIGTFEQLQDVLGPESDLSQQPELLDQLLNLMEIPQGRRGEVQKFATGLMGKRRQAMLGQFREAVSAFQAEVADLDTEPAQMTEMIKLLAPDADPKTIGAFEQMMKQRAQAKKQRRIQSLQLFARPLMGIPEAADLLREVMAGGAFGGPVQSGMMVGGGAGGMDPLLQQLQQGQPAFNR